MKERVLILIACFFASATLAFAQTKTVQGSVVDELGEPIIGASVMVEGTTQGSVTDADGHFVITNVSASAKRLKISYVGMITNSVAITPGNIRVVLKIDASNLDEVMVVAYGTQKKSSFTGAAAVVKSEELGKLQVSNVSKALEGAVAGVQTASSSGTPGSAASIIVRGIGSVSASQSPLIIVDGVPYEGSLNSISTQDIESMTVLKDAAANSMYGARGANGVIMITTKGSKSGKAKINFDAKWGFNARGVGDYDIITDPGEYYEMMYESYRNSLIGEMGYQQASNFAAQNLISQNLKYNIFAGVADNQLINPLTGKLNPNATTRKWNDDWTTDPYENGLRQEYNANVTAGNKTTQAYMSIGYLGDEGYVTGSNFDRISARVKLDQKIGEYVKVGANLAYSKTEYSTFGDTDDNYSNIFMFSQQIAPIYPIYLYDANGEKMYDDKGNVRYDYGDVYARPYAPGQNPYANAVACIHENNRDNFSSRGYFEAKFLKDFTFTANVAYDVFNINYTDFMTPIGGDAGNVGGRGYNGFQRYEAMNANQILDWNRDFGAHNVHLMAVHESKSDRNRNMDGHMTGFQDPTNPEFSNAALYQDMTSASTEYALEGWLAKGEYSYGDKYYFTASIRRDASSRFHPDVRWGTFWAVGGAWRIANEDFFEPYRGIVNQLKLKASYGTQGNDNIGFNRAYTDLYAISRLEGGNAAFTKVFRGNPDLTWEKQSMFNVGFEASFIDRISLNFDFFIKNNADMLFQSPLASSEGNPTYIWRNELDMRNTGFEVELFADIIKTEDIKWSANLNISHYKNELTKLPDSKPADQYPDGFQRGSYWWKLGSSVYNWAGYEYVGVDEATGLPQYNKYTEDADGNEVVEIVNTEGEATIVDLGKSAIPDFTGGFGTTFEAFNFDLSIQTAFQIGGYVRDSYYFALMNSGRAGSNFHKDMFNRWTNGNTQTDIPALFFEGQNNGISGSSDFFLTDASYFSLRNVTLGYTLPEKWTKKAGIEKFRVYFAGDNLALFSARKGLDPRQDFGGATGYVYSALSTYSLGINLTF